MKTQIILRKLELFYEISNYFTKTQIIVVFFPLETVAKRYWVKVILSQMKLLFCCHFHLSANGGKLNYWWELGKEEEEVNNGILVRNPFHPSLFLHWAKLLLNTQVLDDGKNRSNKIRVILISLLPFQKKMTTFFFTFLMTKYLP